jgi:hypothetical protein
MTMGIRKGGSDPLGWLHGLFNNNGGGGGA